MILAKIDEDEFLDLVRNARLIAFQKLEFGYAIAAPLVAFYAPMTHPGGGNLPPEFAVALGSAFVKRMEDPHARTLRPTAKPIPTQALVSYLRSAFGDSPESMANYPKAAGDHPAVIDSECQVVIQAIEEHGQPDFKEAIIPAKRDVMSDAISAVIDHSESVRELAEVGDWNPYLVHFHILQASRALTTALTLLLKP